MARKKKPGLVPTPSIPCSDLPDSWNFLLSLAAVPSPELLSPGPSRNFGGPRAQLGAAVGAVPPPGAAAAWNQSLTLFCERQITDFGGIIRPTRWEMEKQDNFPANFPACLPPFCVLGGEISPLPSLGLEISSCTSLGRKSGGKGWEKQGWSRA